VIPENSAPSTEEHQLRTDSGPTPSATMSFAHFRAGLSMDEVAEKMERAKSTVSNYLAAYIRQEKITDPAPWIDAEVVSRVEEATRHVDIERLKPIHEHLEGAVSYEEIRTVVECLKVRHGDGAEADDS